MTREYRLLGTMKIEDDGKPSPVMKYSKGRALLAFLIVTKGSVEREKAADILWKSKSTSQSFRNLRALLFHIRPFVPELETSLNQLTFQVNEKIFVDLYELETGLKEKEVSRLDEGLSYYAGDLLAGFDLKDAPHFWEWLLIERERLRQRVWDGYQRVCTSYYEQYDWAKGVEAARRWLGLDELDETPHQWLMKFLAADGQKTAALEQYEKCRHILQEELGVEPNAKTVELAEQIQQLPENLNDSFSLTQNGINQPDLPPPGELAKPGALPPHSYLPYHRNNLFTGRKGDLLHLADLLLPTQLKDGVSLTRSVVITGMGGIGKSQLAVEYAFRYGRYYKSVHWFNFDQPENIAEEFARIGSERSLGLYATHDRLPLVEQVNRVQRLFQEPTPRLLIFDNCEVQSLLQKWLPVSGGCRVLLTSRRSHWARELKVSVYPLSTLSERDSKKLLQSLEPSLSNQDAAEIGLTLGNLPLALHLAGNFLGRYQNITAAQYLVKLREKGLSTHPSLHGEGVEISPTNHELSVARTFAFSMEKLSPADETDLCARHLMIRAACLAPGEKIPTMLLQATMPQHMRDNLQFSKAIQRLFSLGLLQERKPDSVIVHHLLADYTFLHLPDFQVEARTAVETAVVEFLEEDYITYGHLMVLPFSPIHLRYVTNYAFETESDLVVELGIVLAMHLRDLQLIDESSIYFDRILSIAQANKKVDQQIRILLETAKIQPNLKEAYETTSKAESLARSGKSPKDLAKTLHYKAWLLYQMGKGEEALAVAKQVLYQIDQAEDPKLTVDILNLIGMILYYSLGQYEAAHQYQIQALPLLPRVRTAYSKMSLLNSMAENARLQGFYSQSVELYEEARNMAREGNNFNYVYLCQINICNSLIGLGKYETAERQLKELKIESINWRIRSELYRLLAQAYLMQGKNEAALAAAQQSFLNVVDDIPYDVGRVWRILGQIAAHFNEPIQVNPAEDRFYNASTCFANSLTIFNQADVKRDRAITLWHWAEYELAQGNVDHSQQMAQEAYTIFEDLQLPFFMEQVSQHFSSAV